MDAIGVTNLFSFCRNWEVSISKFSDQATCRCGTFVKKLNEIPLKEAQRLGYRRCTRKIENVHTQTIEEE